MRRWCARLLLDITARWRVEAGALWLHINLHLGREPCMKIGCTLHRPIGSCKLSPQELGLLYLHKAAAPGRGSALLFERYIAHLQCDRLWLLMAVHLFLQPIEFLRCSCTWA